VSRAVEEEKRRRTRGGSQRVEAARRGQKEAGGLDFSMCAQA